MPKSWLFYLYSTGNILGSALGLVGLILFFFGIINDYWTLIVLGLYVVGYRLAPKHANIHLDTKLAKEDELKAAEKLVKQSIDHMSAPAAEALSRVWEILMDLIKRLDRFDQNDRVVHDIQQTATKHLPDLITPYLELPPAFARFHPLKENKTARDLLIEQLRKLENTLNETLHDALNQDVEKMRIQSEFLDQTFSKGKNWLSL
ncbi:MAG: hypothetical protein KME56_08120 [Candidatus Thiodiazotropha sp. (ex Ctena orbiculata)]|uniref:5-bromo-4-chloroindolyl phosphate hydrolysis protein n=1 Tax=Candidatus Thiodiazotropha taylori TaxID=2792791 RepID=A0A944MHK3_9GAMM|nr:hypothetical protein [Candidatus Thiodiazotropha taylori]PUB86107.1 MAG: hypothetical protein DBP00_12175 [gamma proteobacterium symbiont of Ctena orbiculata]MBT2991080.1 hypothetical protein [Candidatus Thiodiazotropha taylori]MBT2996582.1 hypothetical protein [Candidatus Thiodiazotropha taylori]MBT3000622.1 hypothetical protein [Candidatus Thiodiazotropha taylori]